MLLNFLMMIRLLAIHSILYYNTYTRRINERIFPRASN